MLTGAVDRLAWQRKGLWSAYPEDHIGRNAGVAYRDGKGAGARVGIPPTWPWGADEKNYVLYGKYDLGGRGSNDFRSMKENIWFASAIVAGTEKRVRAESDAKDSVRIQVLDDPATLVDDRDPRVKLVGAWVPVDDDIRSYKGTESYSKKAGDSAEFAFQGTGVAWIGSKERFHGRADVFVDSHLEAADVDLNSGPPATTPKVGTSSRVSSCSAKKAWRTGRIPSRSWSRATKPGIEQHLGVGGCVSGAGLQNEAGRFVHY